ncbi:hypothetical protein FKM82_008709 [Ascaphus truei]
MAPLCSATHDLSKWMRRMTSHGGLLGRGFARKARWHLSSWSSERDLSGSRDTIHLPTKSSMSMTSSGSSRVKRVGWIYTDVERTAKLLMDFLEALSAVIWSLCPWTFPVKRPSQLEYRWERECCIYPRI